MNYNFPHIEHIDQVRAAIADYPEFIVAERGPLLVVNYNVNLEHSFGDPHDLHAQIRRECRGLKFDRDSGHIVARPYHKFFNTSEREETQVHHLSLDQPHSILEKLDGSMIHAVPVGDTFRFCTKMGMTDVCVPVERFVDSHPQYMDMVRDMHELGYTAIYEWCSPQQRIVIDYDQDQLILTAVRDTVSGQYWNYDRLCAVAQEYDVPVVAQLPGTMASMNHLIEHTRGLQGFEGYVVRWHSGHMVKIKADHYVLLHRTKDQIRLEKNIIDILINEGADDLKPLLDQRDFDRFVEFENRFWRGVDVVVDQLQDLYQQGQQYQSRRDYAVEFVNCQPHHVRPLLFGMRDGVDARQLVVEAIRGSTGTQTRVDSNRWLWNNEVWVGGIYLGDN